VQKHNEKILSDVNEELIVLEAIYESHSKEIGFVAYENTMRLLSIIIINCNVIVDLNEENYNIEDGVTC